MASRRFGPSFESRAHCFQFPMLLALVALACASLARAAPVSVSILYTGEIRGAVMPVDSLQVPCVLDSFGALTSDSLSWTTNVGACFGGAARRQQFIAEFRAANANSLVLDGGSSFYGGLMYEQLKSPAYMADLMAMAQYDAIALSEADFADGSSALRAFIDRVNITGAAQSRGAPAFLASNVDVSREPTLAALGAQLSYRIFSFGSLKVGVFGMVDVAVAASSPTLVFNAKAPGANTSIPNAAVIGSVSKQLRQRGCNAVVMLTSQNVDALVDDVAQVSGVDLVLTTHYRNGRNPAVPVASFPLLAQTYFSTPAALDSFAVAGVQTFYGGSVLSLSLTFDNGVLLSPSSNLSARVVALTNATQASPTGDATAWALSCSLYSQLKAAEPTPLAYAAQFVEGASSANATVGNTNCRHADCPMGRVLTAAIQQWCSTCDVIMINGGGIRSSFAQGPILIADVRRAFPFRNTLSYFSATGAVIISALTNMAQQGGAGTGAFLQVAGMRFAWTPDKTVSPLQAVLEVEIFDRTLQAYVALDRLKLYKIGTYAFLRQGGNGYAMFADKVLNTFDDGPTDTLVAVQYLRAFASPSTPLVVPTSANLSACFTTATVPLARGAGNCLIVSTSPSADLRLQCPSQANMCTGGPEFALDGLSFNKSQCARCTGLGACADQVCTCAVPSTGLFVGLPVVSGADCATVRRVVQLSSAATGFLYALAALVAALATGTSLVLILKRSEPLIQVTSPRIGLLTCTGALLASASLFVLVASPTDARCQAWAWLVSLSYSLVFSPLFFRTYRIHKIFNSVSLQTVSITDLALTMAILGVTAIDVLLLLWWQLSAPLVVTGQLVPSQFAVCITCSLPVSSTYSYVVFCFKAVQTLWGVYLAFAVRNVTDNFNESRFIGIAIYNVAVACVIVVPVVYKIKLSAPDSAVLLTGLLTAYVAAFSLCAMYATRFYALFGGASLKASELHDGENARVELRDPRKSSKPSLTRVGSSPVASSSAQSLSTDIQRLRLEVASLAREREALLQTVSSIENRQ